MRSAKDTPGLLQPRPLIRTVVPTGADAGVICKVPPATGDGLNVAMDGVAVGDVDVTASGWTNVVAVGRLAP